MRFALALLALISLGTSRAVTLNLSAPENLKLAINKVVEELSNKEMVLDVRYSDTASHRFLQAADGTLPTEVGSITVQQDDHQRIYINSQGTLGVAEILRVELLNILGVEQSVPVANSRPFTDTDRKSLKTRYNSEGDFNLDNVLDVRDFALLVNNLGKTGSGLVGDMNKDNTVNNTDLLLFKEWYDKQDTP